MRTRTGASPPLSSMCSDRSVWTRCTAPTNALTATTLLTKINYLRVLVPHMLTEKAFDQARLISARLTTGAYSVRHGAVAPESAEDTVLYSQVIDGYDKLLDAERRHQLHVARASYLD